ncbi:MAG: VOC family protein [Bacteroidetes bacterium]|nr:VOC family protein [Bacteroidota bacterium]MCW5896802.1 VOC family protein [Bacteroidota bacterium]
MPSLNPYLNFAGNTEEVFNFYKSVFGGEFLALQRFRDVPPEAGNIPDNEKDKVMHIALPIGKENVLMATDALDSMGQKLIPGNNFYITIQPDSRTEADKLFNGLSAGGTVEMPMQDMFWGGYYGSLRDKFGIQWMINYDTNQKK